MVGSCTPTWPLSVAQARHHQGTRWQHRPFTSLWPLDINMVLADGPDNTWPLVFAQTAHHIVSGGILGYIHQPVPHLSHCSSYTFLHSTGNVLPLFLSHLSTTHLLIIVTPPLRPLAVFSSACVLRMAGWACPEIIFNPSK